MGYLKNRILLSQIHDSIEINQIPGLWGSLLYIPLSLVSLILAFQLPSGEHDACHLGSGDNSKVWLPTIQSLVTSPSLSPCNFAIHHVWKEASLPSAYTEKGDKAIIWGVRHWAGFWTSRASANTGVKRLSSESPGFPHSMQGTDGEKLRETEVEGLHSLQTA